MRLSVAVAVLCLTGCAQILGLEEGTEKSDGGGGLGAGGTGQGGIGGVTGGAGGTTSAGGAGGGGGMSPPVPCGTLFNLIETFDNTVLDGELWNPPVNASASAGVLNLAAPAMSFAGLSSFRRYELGESSLTVELGDFNTDDEVALAIRLVAGDQTAAFSFSNLISYTSSANGNTTSVPFAAADFRFVRFEERQGMLHWLHSADGVTYTTVRVSETDMVFPDGPRAGLSILVQNNSLASAQFDVIGVNEGVTAGGWCPMADLTGDANALTDPSLWWRTWLVADPTCVTDSGSGVTLTDTNVSGQCLRYSSVDYDLTGGSIFVKATVPSVNQSTATFGLHPDVSNSVRFELATDDLGERILSVFDHSGLEVSSSNYDTDMHAWWRFLHVQPSTIRAQTSNDGVMWTDFATIALPPPVDALAVSMSVFTSGGAATATFEELGP